MYRAVFGCFLLTVYSVFAITCRDDTNQPVDWFIAYKFPMSYEYAFIIPTSISWQKSSHVVNQSGMIKNTLDALYHTSGHPDSVYAVYNDENPSVSAYSTYGHMKGAFAFESAGLGFWLIHSVPKFVYPGGSYVYPHTGKDYAQHFLCVTLPIAELNPLINQLLVAKPWIQDSYVSSNLDRDYPNISVLFHHEIPKSEKHTVQSFSLPKGDLKMIHISKGNALAQDLYKDLVAPALGVGLNVETWQLGRKSDNEPSSCEIPNLFVYNVRQVSFLQFGVNFTNWHDHSKWAVSLPAKTGDEASPKWVCLGDINRQFSQFHRGGGTMCLQNDVIWNAFSSIVSEVEPCSSQWTESESD